MTEIGISLNICYGIVFSVIPWKQIKGMRTWFAHQYLNMDVEVIWDVVHCGIPPLKDFCEDYLKKC